MNSKNIGLSIMLASVALSSAAYADMGDFDVKPNGCKGVTLCPAYADCIECHNMHLDIGFLLEQMRITNTTFGYVTESSPCNLPACVGFLRPNFRLDWGLTASAGYYLDRDGWFIEATFDWLRSRGRKNFETCDGQRVIPTGLWSRNSCCCPCNGATGTSSCNCIPTPQGPGTPADPSFIFPIDQIGEVESELRVNYFMFQVSLNRASYYTRYLSFEPHWGIKAAWIFYKNWMHFCALQLPSGCGSSCSTCVTPSGVSHRAKTDFWGVGPHVGLDTKFALCEGFSFFADNSIGLLIGRSKVDDLVFQDPANPAGSNASCCGPIGPAETCAFDKINTISPVVRIIIGVQYDKCVCDDTQAISVKAGFDANFYWNQYQHISVIEEHTVNKFYSIQDGTFGLFGLIVEFGWDF